MVITFSLTWLRIPRLTMKLMAAVRMLLERGWTSKCQYHNVGGCNQKEFHFHGSSVIARPSYSTACLTLCRLWRECWRLHVFKWKELHFRSNTTTKRNSSIALAVCFQMIGAVLIAISIYVARASTLVSAYVAARECNFFVCINCLYERAMPDGPVPQVSCWHSATVSS